MTRRTVCSQPLFAAILALASTIALAQSTAPAPAAAAKPLAFEVVSVHPHGSAPGGMLGCRIDSCTIANVPLHDIIVLAYNIDNDKTLIGGPSWLTTDTFDITAKLDPADVPAQPLEFRQLADMLQPVLADRFQLKTHRESRVFPVYNLTLAKGGSKLKVAVARTTGPGSQGCWIGIKSAGFRTAYNCTMTDIALNMEHPSGRFVVDKTGLTGHYDWEFCYSNDRTPEGDPNYQCPSVFTAVEQQLGLKLEPSNAPIDILVIDSAEKPSAN
jgi:uncharacterized protein (TIGR03435 family)